MELVRISENALKVTLTREDMESYDIVFETLDYKNTETRRALSQILAEAKRTVGFAAESDSLYIQAFSDGDGGCELFVRRSDGAAGQLYEFRSLSLLLIACARLLNCGFIGDSSAYRLRGGESYFLHLSVKSDGTYIFLSEIARRIRLQSGFLAEHTEKICENAVETLGKLS